MEHTEVWELGLNPVHGAAPKSLLPSQLRAEVLPCSGPFLPGPVVLSSARHKHTPSLSPSLSLSLPLAVVFPQDLLEKGLDADNFAMLGLGDIVIPGEDRRKGTWPGLSL